MVYRDILEARSNLCLSIRDQGITAPLIKVKHYPAQTREHLREGVEVHTRAHSASITD